MIHERKTDKLDLPNSTTKAIRKEELEKPRVIRRKKS